MHDTPGNAAKFILANKDRPFFVNVWLHENHLPHGPTKESLAKWKHLDEQKQVYAAVITDGDDAVGKVLDALKKAGVEQHTIVLFSSDNGPESTGTEKNKSTNDEDVGMRGYGAYYSIGSTGGLRGRKRSLFEGGVRVPFIVRWPGHTPEGKKNNSTVLTAVDLLPTLCACRRREVARRLSWRRRELGRRFGRKGERPHPAHLLGMDRQACRTGLVATPCRARRRLEAHADR